MSLSIVIFVTVLASSGAQFYPIYDLQICAGLADNAVIGIQYECFKYYYCSNGVAFLDDCRNICKGCQFDFRINDCNYEVNVQCSQAQIQSNLPIVQTPTQVWLPALQNLQFLPWLSTIHAQQNQQVMQNVPEQPQPQPITNVEQEIPTIVDVPQIQPISIVEEIETGPSETKEICQLNFRGFHPDRYIHLLCPSIQFETNISFNEFSMATQGGVHSKMNCNLRFNCSLQIEVSPCVSMKVEIPPKVGFYSEHVVTVISYCDMLVNN